MNREMGPSVTDSAAIPAPEGRSGWAESLAPVLGELRGGLRLLRPHRMALLAGAEWSPERAVFRLRLLNEEFEITWPELIVYPAGASDPSPPGLQALFLYYLSTADGSPPRETWVAFRELPNGWLYHEAFQGYTGDALVRAIGSDLDGFARAAESVGGRPVPLGDAGFAFDALPQVPLSVAYWRGDEEFPPRAQILFDGGAGHYLPTDGLAFLGRHLVDRLLPQGERSAAR